MAGAASRYVSPSGNDAMNDCMNPMSPCLTIGAGLDQANSGDVIKLAGGIYYESVLIDESVTIALEGGYATDFATRDLTQFETKVDGENVRTGIELIVPAGGALDVTVDGLTITRTAGRCAIYANGDTPDSAVLTVRNLLAERNECGMNGFDSIVTVEDSVFRKNRSDGLVFGDAVDATIERTLLSRNGFGGVTASGAVGSILVRNSVFYANFFPAITVQFGGSMTVTVANSTIAKTRLPYNTSGGAINISSCPTTLNLHNTIVWRTRSRSANDIVADCGAESAEVNASHSSFAQVFPHDYNNLGGNVSANPRLRSGESAQLRSDSPMIDAADCALAPSVDVDGDARPSGEGCDIGADEFVSP